MRKQLIIRRLERIKQMPVKMKLKFLLDPLTLTHFGKNFELSSAESYFLEKAAKVDRSLTMVSTVLLKNGKHTYESQAMWDNCSSDHWCSHGLAKRLKAKVLSDWSGNVKTINGIEAKTLAR